MNIIILYNIFIKFYYKNNIMIKIILILTLNFVKIKYVFNCSLLYNEQKYGILFCIRLNVTVLIQLFIF